MDVDAARVVGRMHILEVSHCEGDLTAFLNSIGGDVRIYQLIVAGHHLSEADCRVLLSWNRLERVAVEYTATDSPWAKSLRAAGVSVTKIP
jgi:hypothetical protein